MDKIAMDKISMDKISMDNIKIDTIADNATLEFFTNPSYLNIIKRKLVKTPEDDNNIEAIKFYKKRMISLFKDIFKEDNPTISHSSLGGETQSTEPFKTQSSLGGETPTPSELKEAHKRFALLAVKYFETIDKKDIIQEQHTSESRAAGEADMADIDTSNLFTMDDANNVMMRKTITYSNLDNYVIMKEDLSANDLRIIPMKIDINLKTPDLKIKGLKPKIKKSKNTKEDLSQQILVNATPQIPIQEG